MALDIVIIELLNASGAKILIGSPIFMGDLDEVSRDVPSLKQVIISIPGEGGEFLVDKQLSAYTLVSYRVEFK
jgi:hypothetical protein